MLHQGVVEADLAALDRDGQQQRGEDLRDRAELEQRIAVQRARACF
jgi:hypothetical protein